MTQLIKMIKISEESPSSILKPSFARMIAVRQSSGTETPQLLLSYESCEELRSRRIDETGTLVGARLRAA